MDEDLKKMLALVDIHDLKFITVSNCKNPQNESFWKIQDSF